jgi:hypothetical protein
MIAHYIAPIPYSLADALLAEVFMLHYSAKGQATRRTISSGSCIYTVHEMMGIKPGQIYLRETFNSQTYIRPLSHSSPDDLDELLGLFLFFMNESVKREEENLSSIPSIESIQRSKDTYESWARGATYEKRLPLPSRTHYSLKYPEDKRAIEELRANPDQRESIRQRWWRAVERNKSRKLSANSMQATFRRLAKQANESLAEDSQST